MYPPVCVKSFFQLSCELLQFLCKYDLIYTAGIYVPVPCLLRNWSRVGRVVQIRKELWIGTFDCVNSMYIDCR